MTYGENPRLFVAVPLPDAMKAEVGRFIERIRPRCAFKRWVHPDDLHLTLKFIGEVAPGAIAGIEAELERIAARSYPFELRLKGVGTFGAPHAPRVLWAGVDGKLTALRALQADVERQLAAIGFPPEGRRYSPHVTLARQYADGAPLPAEALREARLDGGAVPLAWAADRIVLYRSRLGRSPMYEPLRTIAFHAGG